MNAYASRALLLPFAASLAMGLMSQSATAATISTSIVIPATAGDGFTLIPATGLAQFDPANGTLTGIELGLHVSSYDMTISLSSWDDPGTGAVFQSADLQGQISINVALPGGGGLLFSSTVFGDTIFNEFDTISTVGTPGIPQFQDATARLIADNLFSDFIGTGSVSILSLGIFSFGYPDMVTLDDGTFTDGGSYLDAFNFGPSMMTINYTYAPAVVPLPPTILLLGSALMGLVGLRQKTARKQSKLK